MEIHRMIIINMEIKMEKEKTCKIVFSDIDGTLLTSDGRITEGTKEMILNLERKGVLFILTSARSPEGVRVIKNAGEPCTDHCVLRRADLR